MPVLYHPAASDIAFFREHGWWVSPPILAEDLLTELRIGVDRYLAGERDWALPENLGAAPDEAPVAQIDYLSLQLKEFHRVVRSPQIGAIAAALADTDSVRLFHDQLVIKWPRPRDREGVVGWHTDKAYWQSCSSSNMLTAWIPLEDVPKEAGPLAVWDGSHKWQHVEHLHTFDCDDLAALEQPFRDLGLEPDIRLLEIRKRELSFHHCRLVHGSHANRTGTPRCAYAIHLQDADNRFWSTSTSGRRPGHINDLLCRKTPMGMPDYEDPDICPRLWPPAPTSEGTAASAPKPGSPD